MVDLFNESSRPTWNKEYLNVKWTSWKTRVGAWNWLLLDAFIYEYNYSLLLFIHIKRCHQGKRYSSWTGLGFILAVYSPLISPPWRRFGLRFSGSFSFAVHPRNRLFNFQTCIHSSPTIVISLSHLTCLLFVIFIVNMLAISHVGL